MANEETSKSASVEVHFAQRLAANEKKIRDRAMKKLRKWFELKSLTKKGAQYLHSNSVAMIHHFLFSFRCSLFWCKHKELCY